ncbi:hypothetical protein J6590_090775 [Homalodisca vitripennis]|nr:hypothetical protein J6590_090775 [Homalodisca vitripennis]
MSFCTVFVDLQHADRRAPVFLADHYEITLPENMAEPSFLVLVAAEDTDSEGAIEGEVTYSLPSDKHRSMVSIDPLTGLLRSKKALDREKRALYDILVMASDTSGHVGFTSVHLTVTDVNDNSPKFILPEYLACVPSNLTVNSAFLKVRATDADKGPAAQVTYTLQSPQDSETHQLFSVHPVSGTLYLQQPVLSLEGQVYQFFVRAADRGSPSLHSDVPVRVYIMDFTDELPAFQRTDETFFIPEDAPLGYNVTQLVLSSPLQVDYRLLATGSQFSVSPDGWLYLSAPLDREAVALHTLGAVAQSRAAPRLATLDTITVVVLDCNDNHPVFHSALYRTAVAENVAVGTSIMQVEAEDADEGRNGEVYYLLEGEGVFTIDTYTGWVVTSGALDRELKTSHNLTVVAVDNGSPALSSSTSLLVDLIDYNDNPPVFSQDVYTVSVKEDLEEGSEVLLLEASDLDSDSVLKFYISGGDPDLQFAMDEAVPGVMYLRRGLDREFRDSYRLTVLVSDSKFIATAQVALHVLDVNDERPYCVQSRYYATLAENAAPGTFVLTVAVEDPDLQPSVSFHLAGDGADHFYLHKEKGELKTSKLLDRETMPRYSLKAYAYDDSYPEWECVSYVELTLTDVNDNAPEFHLASHKVSLSEDSAVGAFITKLTAVDADRGVNRKIRYYLVNSGENHFEVDKDSAIVRLAKTLDREAQSMFTLILKAVDSGMPQLWTLTTLQVTSRDD